MEKLLFIDACIRGEQSRTKKLCDEFIRVFTEKHPGIEVETVELRKGFCEPHTYEHLLERDSYVDKRDFSHPMFDLAKQFKEADYIVVGTPYWDLSFAAILKVYIENIEVAHLTFDATATGFEGLCNGHKLFYITTAGGFIGERNYGYDYMCAVAEMLGIPETEFFKAEGLDVEGFDSEKIMAMAMEEIRHRI